MPVAMHEKEADEMNSFHIVIQTIPGIQRARPYYIIDVNKLEPEGEQSAES